MVASDSSQTRITDYHSILNVIEQLTIENQTLSDLLRHVNIHEEVPSCSLMPVLKQIISNAEKNAEKLPCGRRHPEVLKKFCIALFIYAGLVAYDFLQQNLSQALPSLPTIRRIVHSQYKTMNEGDFQFDDLVTHITQHKAPSIITIGEDATRIICRVR